MIYYAISGYLIFGVTTLVTLDKFLSRRTIIYFVLALALIGQNSLQLEEKREHDYIH